MQGLASSSAATARSVAIQLLARREHSRAELASKLEQKSFDHAEIANCLALLAAQGLQSDQRFAESFVRSRIARGQGLVRVKYELLQREVEKTTISAAIAIVEKETGLDWHELALTTLAKRFTTPGETPKERAKRERFLASRGFDFEQIRSALHALGA